MRLDGNDAAHDGSLDEEAVEDLQPFDPRVAGLGDPDLEAVDAGLKRPVRHDPDG